MRRLSLLALSAVLLAAPAAADHHAEAGKAAMTPARISPALAAAVADPRRDEDRARDVWRKPAETLSFFQVGPEMKVGEYAPGGGWYSRLLGLYLGPKGKLVGLYFDPTSGAFSEQSQKGIRDGAAKYPADVAGWSGLPAERFSAMTLESIPDAEKGTFDRIIVARMMHNLMRWNIADREIKAMRSLLKDSGLIGIEQHRAKADAPFSYADGSKGYLREADVIKFMEVNGFDYVGKSEANANPRDTANHPEGVWELPPSWRTKREELKGIGESDRMTLLFRKRA
ncbi:MAG: methyltransferase [Novosphingobium sp.]|nr:methyltransferase [Novosphingobium sp.]